MLGSEDNNLQFSVLELLHLKPQPKLLPHRPTQ